MYKEKSILDYTDAEYTELVNRIVYNGHVVLHDQDLTRQQLAEVCAKMGEVEE